MKTIREIAMEEIANQGKPRSYVEFAESVLAAYLAQQEPVAEFIESPAGDYWTIDASKAKPGAKLYLAPPVPAGMQLVPIEPTEAMLAAMQSSGWMPGNYKALIEAAKEQK